MDQRCIAGMDRCSEYRLSLGSTSTHSRTVGETSIYDTYGRDWACMSARSTCTRSQCQSEIGDPSELTWLLKERRLTHASTASDDSTEPPNDFQGDTGGSSTPVTGGDASVPLDQSGFVSSRQATVFANICSDPSIPVNFTYALTLKFASTSSLAPRFDTSGPPVIFAKPAVQDTERIPYPFPGYDTPQSYRICNRNPLLSFRSYDSVHCYESSKGQLSRQSSFLPSARSAHSRSNSWAPPSSRPIRERESDACKPCDIAECMSESSSDLAPHVTNSSSPKPPATHVVHARCAPPALQRQNSFHSEVALVDCHVSASQSSSNRSFSASSHAGSGRRRIRSQTPRAPSSSRRHVQSSDVGVQCVIDGAKVEFINSCRITKESKIRSQSAVACVEARPSNREQSRIVSSTIIPPSSPERHLRSPDLEINRDVGGVTIGFKDLARYRSAPSLASPGSSSTQIVRSSSVDIRVSDGFKEDRFRPVARSRSWVPPSCESRLPARAQSWAPPLQPKSISETLTPLPSSRNTCRDIVRPLCSSRVSSLERPPHQRDTSRDIVRPLPSSRVSSLAPPSDRQVCSTYAEPYDVFQSQRLPSPPRRKVSRQLSHPL